MSVALNCTRRETRCDWEEPETHYGACDGIPCSAVWVDECEMCGIALCERHAHELFGRMYCPTCYRELD